jgi:hypothetical protein
MGLKILIAKNRFLIDPMAWTDYLDKQQQLRKTDTRYGTWHVRSLYRTGSIITVGEELSKHKLDLILVCKAKYHSC